MAGGHQFFAALATLIRKSEHYKFNKRCQAANFHFRTSKSGRFFGGGGKVVFALFEKGIPARRPRRKS
jgi:hypothetical protein